MAAGISRIKLRVAPGASRSQLVGRHGDAWKVRVTAAPEQGRANEAVVGLLAEKLDLPRDRVTLISGHGGKDKVVELVGIDEEEATRRLERAEEGG